MEIQVQIEHLVVQWRRRAEECRDQAPVRADTFDTCAAQLADLLARFSGAGTPDRESFDLFGGERSSAA